MLWSFFILLHALIRRLWTEIIQNLKSDGNFSNFGGLSSRNENNIEGIRNIEAPLLKRKQKHLTRGEAKEIGLCPGRIRDTYTRVLLSYIIYVMTQEKNNNCIITCSSRACLASAAWPFLLDHIPRCCERSRALDSMKNVRVNRVAPTLPNGKNIEIKLFSFFCRTRFLGAADQFAIDGYFLHATTKFGRSQSQRESPSC